MALESLDATLRRRVDRSQCKLVFAPGYRVNWTYSVECRFRDNHRRTFDGAFLNIEPAPNDTAEGILVPVSAADLEWLDQRERGYLRVPISGTTATQHIWQGHTYRADREHVASADRRYFIPRNYVALIESALERWKGSLRGHLCSQAFPVPHPIVEEPVQFADPKQQDASRRGVEDG